VQSVIKWFFATASYAKKCNIGLTGLQLSGIDHIPEVNIANNFEMLCCFEHKYLQQSVHGFSFTIISINSPY